MKDVRYLLSEALIVIPYMDNYSTAFDAIWWQASFNVTRALMLITAIAITLKSHFRLFLCQLKKVRSSCKSSYLYQALKKKCDFFFVCDIVKRSILTIDNRHCDILWLIVHTGDMLSFACWLCVCLVTLVIIMLYVYMLHNRNV